MGVMCCPDPPNVKALTLYNVLQEGGIQENEFIAATDKDFPPTWELLCKLSTVHLFQWCQDIDDYEGKFTAKHKELLADCYEDQLESYLDAVFGNKSRLSYKEFISKTIEKE